jgi:hypothetical protein
MALLVLTVLFIPLINGSGTAFAKENAPGGIRSATPVLPLPDGNTKTKTPALLAVTRVYDMGDRYLVFGEFRADLVQASLPAGLHADPKYPTFTDARGTAIDATIPPDDIYNNESLWPPNKHPDALVWVYEISKGFVAPLTISEDCNLDQRLNGQTKLQVDVGKNPQPGQVWQLNKSFVLHGHAIRLVNMQAQVSTGGRVQYQGYSFNLESDDPLIYDLNMDIAGYTPIGWMGGGGSATAAWNKYTGFLYPAFPKGKLTLVFSRLRVIAGSRTFQFPWTPTHVIPFPAPAP